MDKNDRKVVIELRDVRREFHVGSEGEFVTIMGTSGSGKSTLLNQLGCLDTPTSGEYILDGVPVRKMRRSERAVLRNRKIGFIFQNYNLLAKTTAVENVELPLMYNKTYNARQRREPARPQEQSDVWRTDAACRHRKSVGQQPSRHPGRRSDR